MAKSKEGSSNKTSTVSRSEQILELDGDDGLSTRYCLVEGAPDWLVAFRVKTQKKSAFSTMAIFDGSKPQTPRLVGRCALPPAFVAAQAGNVKVQKIDDTLFIGDMRGYVEVDVSDPAKPVVKRSLRHDAQRTTHWFGREEVVFLYYGNDSDGTYLRAQQGLTQKEAKTYPLGDGLFRQPLGGASNTIERVGKLDDLGADSLGVGEQVLFLHSKGVTIYDPAKRKEVGTVAFRNSLARLAGLPAHSLVAVLSSGESSDCALRFLELKKPRPTPGARLFEGLTAKAWCLDGDTLFLILQKTGKNPSFSLGAVRLPSCSAEALLPLPGEFPWDEVAWLKVAGGRMAALFGDGAVCTVRLDS